VPKDCFLLLSRHVVEAHQRVVDMRYRNWCLGLWHVWHVWQLWQLWEGGVARSWCLVVVDRRVETREQQGSKLAPCHVKRVLFFHLAISLSYFGQRLPVEVSFHN